MSKLPEQSESCAVCSFYGRKCSGDCKITPYHPLKGEDKFHNTQRADFKAVESLSNPILAMQDYMTEPRQLTREKQLFTSYNQQMRQLLQKQQQQRQRLEELKNVTPEEWKILEKWNSEEQQRLRQQYLQELRSLSLFRLRQLKNSQLVRDQQQDKEFLRQQQMNQAFQITSIGQFSEEQNTRKFKPDEQQILRDPQHFNQFVQQQKQLQNNESLKQQGYPYQFLNEQKWHLSQTHEPWISRNQQHDQRSLQQPQQQNSQGIGLQQQEYPRRFSEERHSQMFKPVEQQILLEHQLDKQFFQGHQQHNNQGFRLQLQGHPYQFSNERNLQMFNLDKQQILRGQPAWNEAKNVQLNLPRDHRMRIGNQVDDKEYFIQGHKSLLLSSKQPRAAQQQPHLQQQSMRQPENGHLLQLQQRLNDLQIVVDNSFIPRHPPLLSSRKQPLEQELKQRNSETEKE